MRREDRPDLIEQHLSPRQVAQRLGCSPNTVRNLCQGRYLSSVKLPGRNGRLLIPVSAVAKLLDAHRLPHRDEVASLIRL